MEKSALVTLSGGQDSTTILGWAKDKFKYIETITFDYGQKHKIEIKQAKKIADILEVKNTLLSINAFTELNNSALLMGSDEDMSNPHINNSNIPASFVPNRNAIFFTLAHAFAQKQGIKNIIIGISQADYSGYPDCREEFIKSLEVSLNLGSDENIKFHYPLLNLSKSETFALAKSSSVLDLLLEESHTCYNGVRDKRFEWGYGCAKCPACILRKKGWETYNESNTPR